MSDEKDLRSLVDHVDLAKHTALVSLTLSGVAKLHRIFRESANSDSLRRVSLTAAADLLDRTLPDEDLKETLKATGPDKHVAALVMHRNKISAVPPRFWRGARTRPNDLGSAHYAGFRALDRILRRDPGEDARTWALATDWLAPAWDEYPALKPECLFLSNPGGTYSHLDPTAR